ncbi:hypothetical protein P8805_21695, partial [Bacillus subtilis]
LKPDEYLKKLYKTKKLVEKTSFSLQAEAARKGSFFTCSAASLKNCEVKCSLFVSSPAYMSYTICFVRLDIV